MSGVSTTNAARYTTQLGRAAHSARPGRESLSKRLGKVAKQIKMRDGGACVYCRRTAEASGGPLHIDHLTPKALGGEDVPQNLAMACARCNSAKTDMTLSRWAGYAEAKFGLVFEPRAIRGQARRALPEIRRAA
jgi:5-methylcytosine-specific restriction endonuclease McrA